jgi:cytochrome P450
MTECIKCEDFTRVPKNESRISDCKEYVPFVDEQLTHSVQDLFDGGSETTSSTLRWALLYLINHQDWQESLQNDIDDVIGQGQPQMEHKDKLPRIEAFILEVQRLANLVPSNLPHTSNEDFVYNGYIFPKGAMVFGVLDSVLNDPEIFPEPSKFKPERFLDTNGICHGEQKDKLIPFSIGKYLKYTTITISNYSYW